jgi:uncharacterized phiE125 gp8 family phage protein
MPYFVQIESPGVEPLSAVDLRARLSIAATVSDTVVNGLISAARLIIEQQYSVAFITQTLEYVINHFPGYAPVNRETGFGGFGGIGVQRYFRGTYDDVMTRAEQTDIVIPYSPIQKINSIKYLDMDGVQQLIAPVDYLPSYGELFSRIRLPLASSWPSTQLITDGVRIQFDAGFGDGPSDVDEHYKMAITLQAAHFRSLMANNLFTVIDSVTGVGEKRYLPSEVPGKVIDRAVSAIMGSFIRPSL